MAVTQIINKQTSPNLVIMYIVRPLILKLIQHNIHLRAKHIPGHLNILADKISRFQVTPQLLHRYGMDMSPTPMPQTLKPENFKIK